MLDAAEGIDRFDDEGADRNWWIGDADLATVYISIADAQCELWAPQVASGSLRLALSTGFEDIPFDKWRLDDNLRSLPPELIDATVPLHARTHAIEWLDERRRVSDREWDETWVKHLMLERAVGGAGSEAFLLDLGYSWLEARSDIYEVWRPLVELHAEAPDASKLAHLTEMVALPHADVRFGVRLRAAVRIVEDLRERDAPQQ